MFCGYLQLRIFIGQSCENAAVCKAEKERRWQKVINPHKKLENAFAKFELMSVEFVSPLIAVFLHHNPQRGLYSQQPTVEVYLRRGKSVTKCFMNERIC